MPNVLAKSRTDFDPVDKSDFKIKIRRSVN